MKWAHFQAMLYLHWCLMKNRIRRTRIISGAVSLFLLVVGSLIMLGIFYLSLRLGVNLLPKALPLYLMLTWVGIACGFISFWTFGLLMALQRSDSMSIAKFLHLPAPLGWVLVYNYLCSYFALSMAICLPAMLGLSVAMILVHGPVLLISVPLVLGFVGMITALTYQFRGWLERLMRNKRHRQYVIAAVTFTIVALAQVPSLFNIATMRSGEHEGDGELGSLMEVQDAARKESGRLLDRIKTELEQEPEEETVASESLDEIEGLQNREEEIDEEISRVEIEQSRMGFAQIDRMVSPFTLYIPFGWLPYGMRAAVEGRFLASALCTLGMFWIALWSLRRSYKSTLAFLTGATSKRSAAIPTIPKERTERSKSAKPLLVEKTLPWVTEMESSICVTSLRSLTRMPELKLLLLSPVIFLGIGGYWIYGRSEAFQEFASYLGLGAITMGLISTIQLIQNQFGLDREGFRAYVLCPAPRHEILRAKNLAVAPVSIGIGAIALIVLQCIVPMDLGRFLAAWLQLISAYLILCMLGNFISIVGPVRLQEHSMRAAKMTAGAIVWQMASFVLFPLTLSPLLLPSVGEHLARSFDLPAAGLVYFALHAALLALIGWLYLMVSRGQGEMLQKSEQRILDTLTRRST